MSRCHLTTLDTRRVTWKEVPYWRPKHLLEQKSYSPWVTWCTPVINHCIRPKVIDFNCTLVCTCLLSVTHEVLQHVSSQCHRVLQRRPTKNPITALDRPWGFQEVEAPRFQDNRHMKVVGLSALHTGRLYPQEMIKYITFNFHDSFHSIPWTKKRILWKTNENTNLMQHCAGFISAESLYIFRAQAPIIRSI